jgi:hypothetical protein
VKFEWIGDYGLVEVVAIGPTKDYPQGPREASFVFSKSFMQKKKQGCIELDYENIFWIF